MAAEINNGIPEHIWSAHCSADRFMKSTPQENVDFLYLCTVSTMVFICLNLEVRQQEFKSVVYGWSESVRISNGPPAQAAGKHFEALALLIQMKKASGEFHRFYYYYYFFFLTLTMPLFVFSRRLLYSNRIARTFRGYLTVLKSIDSLNICCEVDHNEMVLAFQNVRFALLVYIVFRFVVETVQGSVGSKDPHVAATWLSDVKNSEKVLFFCFFHYCL
jgi:hypothetical protein